MKEYWNRFLHWKGWGQFIHWQGWSRLVHWAGWKKLFPLPITVDILLFAGCGAGLIWVFLKGLESWWPVYILYGLSGYLLASLCIHLPGAIRRERSWIKAHPKVESTLKDEELKFSLELYFQQFLNFAYGVYKIAVGVIVGSAWIGADGIYNFVQALIQLFLILRRKKPGTLLQQWRAYRLSGWLVLLMHLTLTGIVFQMLNWNRLEKSGEIMIIATAAFAFYKFITAFVDLAKDRKHTQPINSSVRMLELTQAIFAMFSLQAGMFHTFGSGENWEHLMNIVTGCAACLLVCATGIYMLFRANREIKALQEVNHG